MIECSNGYIEVHFYTEDGSHSMNAESLNKCMYEYLGIIKEVTSKNGTSIKCELVIKRKLDAEGNEKITGYEVWSVDATFENDKPIETPEGKRKRQKKEAEEIQLTFDF